MSELRIQLIERLCQLPESQLADVATLLTSLECQSRSLPSRLAAAGKSILNEDKDWPHAPLHRLSENGTYIVTASTLNKEHFFRGEERLTLLEGNLLRLAKEHDLILEAWAVFSNHYHLVAHTTGIENQLSGFIARLHFESAVEINRNDGCHGRPIWFNYWETRLTFQNSYLARLNYVHQNAVKHTLVSRASDYPWCSAAWLERVATPAQLQTISGFKIDRVKLDDDYLPVV
jgi:putative transposase